MDKKELNKENLKEYLQEYIDKWQEMIDFNKENPSKDLNTKEFNQMLQIKIETFDYMIKKSVDENFIWNRNLLMIFYYFPIDNMELKV